MAIVGNMFNPNRINLGEALPLDTPLIIQLETSGFCNLACKFCPCGDDIAKKELEQDIMTEQLFDLFLEQCKLFSDRIKVLRIIGIGEPLMNQNIVSFVSKAKLSGCFEKVEITTNGILLSRELSDGLIGAGLDTLLISLEALDDNTFFEIAGRHIQVNEVKKNFEYFYEHKKETKLYIKTTNMAINDEESFFEEYGKICDYIYVEKVIENWPEFQAGAIPGTVRYEDAYYKTGKRICVQPFKVLCIAANGDVMPCSVDWKRILKLGNITKHTLKELWTGKRLRGLQRTLLSLCPKGICAICKYREQNQPDDIDGYRKDILRRIEKEKG